MLAVAFYVGVQAVRALIGGSHPETSALGLMFCCRLAARAALAGPDEAPNSFSPASLALRGDGILSIAAAALAAITLATLLMNSALGWWWADAVAALLIATALVAEASRVAVHHRFG